MGKGRGMGRKIGGFHRTSAIQYACHPMIQHCTTHVILCCLRITRFDTTHYSYLGRGNVNPNAGKVGYFKNETIGTLKVKCVSLRPKMYSFTVCDALKPIPKFNYSINERYKAVAKGVTRLQIKRIKHEDYMRM